MTTGCRCSPAGGSSVSRTRGVKRGARRAPHDAADPDSGAASVRVGAERASYFAYRGAAPRSRTRSRSAIGDPRRRGHRPRARAVPRRAPPPRGQEPPARHRRASARAARSTARCRTRSRRTAATGSSCFRLPRDARGVGRAAFRRARLGAHRSRARRGEGRSSWRCRTSAGSTSPPRGSRVAASRRRSSSSRSSRRSCSSGSPVCARRSAWRSSRSGPKPGPAVLRALKANRIVCLLSRSRPRR